MSKKLFIKGTLLLTITGLFSRFMGFFYRIFLSHTIGAHGLGIFQLALPLQVLLLSVCSSGIQTALSRFTASETALGKHRRAADHLIGGTFFSVSLSVLLCAALYRCSDLWANCILKEPQTAPLVRMIAFTIPLATFHNCINSYYFGRKKAGFPSAVQLLEQSFRIGGCYLLYQICTAKGLPITPMIAAGGNLAGEAAACFISLFAISMHFHETHYSPFAIKHPFQILKDLLQISVPLTLNKLLLTILGSIEVILIPARLQMSGSSSQEALSIYGVFTGMALPLILFPSTITNSASVMLLPSVTQLQALGYEKRIRYVILRIFRCCMALGIFCMTFFLFFGEFLGEFLFHSQTAGIYIRTMAFVCPFLYLNTTLTSILNGLGKSSLCLLHSVISVCIRVGFVLLAIPVLGIRGYFYGMLCAEIILSILHTRSCFYTL